MPHVNVLRFRVSNRASSTFIEDERTQWYPQEVKQLSSATQISDALEEFMLGRTLVNCIVTPATCKQNKDKDRDDTVDLFYTIFWEPAEDFEVQEQRRRNEYSALEKSIDKLNEKSDIVEQKEIQNQSKSQQKGYDGINNLPQNSWQSTPQTKLQNQYNSMQNTYPQQNDTNTTQTNNSMGNPMSNMQMNNMWQQGQNFQQPMDNNVQQNSFNNGMQPQYQQFQQMPQQNNGFNNQFNPNNFGQ